MGRGGKSVAGRSAGGTGSCWMAQFAVGNSHTSNCRLELVVVPVIQCLVGVWTH